MDFRTAITPDGTDMPQVCAYYVLERSPAMSKDRLGEMLEHECEAFDLTQPGDRLSTWVVEFRCSTFSDFSERCAKLLVRAVDIPEVACCALMFDGVFDGLDSLLSGSCAGSTYGLVSRRSGPILCFDMNMMESSEWTTLLTFIGDSLGRPGPKG